jgi:hypothetical protein
MFGNRFGWGLAVAVAIIYLGMLVILETGGALSAPSALVGNGSNLATLELPVGVKTVAESVGSGAGDATTVIRDIARDVRQREEFYRRFCESPGIRAEDMPQLTALTAVLRQAEMRASPLLTNNPEDVVGYVGVQDLHFAEDVSLAGRAAGRVAMYKRVKKESAQARKYFEAELALGEKMFMGRQSYEEMSKGLGLMSEAAEGLKLLAKDEKDDERLAKLDAFAEGVSKLNERIRPVWEAISTIDPGVMGRHNGDMPVLATKAGERVWRVEATLKLGRMKYDVGQGGTPADQRNAKKLVKVLSGDSDPAVALAGKLASELTVEEYRMIR